MSRSTINIASEASYVYSSLKMPKNSQFGEFLKPVKQCFQTCQFQLDKNWCKLYKVDKSLLKMPKIILYGKFLKTWNWRSNSVTRQVNFNWLVGNAKIKKTDMRQLRKFSNTVLSVKLQSKHLVFQGNGKLFLNLLLIHENRFRI